MGRLGRKVIDCVCVIKTRTHEVCMGPMRCGHFEVQGLSLDPAWSDEFRCGPMRSHMVRCGLMWSASEHIGPHMR